MKFKHLMVAIAVVGLTGCGNSQTAENNGNLQEETIGLEGSQFADGWAFSEDVDPFNDRSIATMSTELVDDAAQLAVTVACGSGKHLAYEFAAYDLDGDPLKLSRFPNSVEREFFSFNELIRYKVRVDQQKAKDRFYFNPEHSNVFMIRPNNQMQPFGLKSGDLRDGSQITIGLNFREGNAVFYLDQTAPRIRTFIDECQSQSGDTAVERSNHQEETKPVEPLEAVSPIENSGDTNFEACLARVPRVESEGCLSAEIDRLDDSIDQDTYEVFNKNCRWETAEEMNASVAHLECLLEEIHRVKS